MSRSAEVVVVPEEGFAQGLSEPQEDGVEVPLDRINPETLRNLIVEFVTREWEELGDAHYTLEDKVRQVQRQLQDRQAKVVFDLATNTCNIVQSERPRRR